MIKSVQNQFHTKIRIGFGCKNSFFFVTNKKKKTCD